MLVPSVKQLIDESLKSWFKLDCVHRVCITIKGTATILGEPIATSIAAASFGDSLPPIIALPSVNDKAYEINVVIKLNRIRMPILPSRSILMEPPMDDIMSGGIKMKLHRREMFLIAFGFRNGSSLGYTAQKYPTAPTRNTLTMAANE
jgi:hypothetical protein